MGYMLLACNWYSFVVLFFALLFNIGTLSDVKERYLGIDVILEPVIALRTLSSAPLRSIPAPDIRA